MSVLNNVRHTLPFRLRHDLAGYEVHLGFGSAGLGEISSWNKSRREVGGHPGEPPVKVDFEI